MFKYKSPVSLPQWTEDKFEEARTKYTAEHGYEIHIPGWQDIVKWKRWDEPTIQELAIEKKAKSSLAKSKYYIRKLGEPRFERIKYAQPGDIDYPTYQEMEDYNHAVENNNKYLSFLEILGDKRYEEIKALRNERKERYARMLASPTPKVGRNAAALITFIDDINDTMGTVGVIARTAHHLIGNEFAKVLLSKVGGYAFTAAQLTSIAMALMRNPLKAKRLQHLLHGATHGNPPSRKLRASVMKRFAKHGIGYGEVIEALQVSNSMFGYGLGLGSIFGLLFDIPSGIYRHIRGEKVTVTGLPRALVSFDRHWSRNIKTLAELWVSAEPWMDDILGKSMVAAKMCTDTLKQMFGTESALASLPNVADIETPILMPAHPLTDEVIRDETPKIEEYLNWPSTGKKWKAILQNWNYDRDEINENIRNWLARNAFDAESYLCKENAIESGFDMLSLIDGDDAVEWKFDSTTQSLLTSLNNDYRFPVTMSDEQSSCYANLMGQYDTLDIDPGAEEVVRVAFERCGIAFTTQVPWRPGETPDNLESEARNTIWRLKRWYFKQWARYLSNEYQFCQGRVSKSGDISMSKMSHYYQWLLRYGFPKGEPAREMSKVDPMTAELMSYCIPNLGARLYGRLDPYTPEKVKAIYDRLAGECPSIADQVYKWDDGLKLAFYSAKNCVLFSRMVDPLEWQKGFEAIIHKHVIPGETYVQRQFGTTYISG